MVTPQTMVACAPIEAPACTSVSTDHPIVAAFQRAIGVDGARLAIIGENAVRSAKYAVFQRYAVIDRNAVLNLDVVAHLDARVDVHAFAQDAVAAQNSAFAHLAVLPDFGAFAHVGLRRNICSRMNKVIAFHDLLSRCVQFVFPTPAIFWRPYPALNWAITSSSV